MVYIQDPKSAKSTYKTPCNTGQVYIQCFIQDPKYLYRYSSTLVLIQGGKEYLTDAKFWSRDTYESMRANACHTAVHKHTCQHTDHIPCTCVSLRVRFTSHSRMTCWNSAMSRHPDPSVSALFDTSTDQEGRNATQKESV